MAKVTTVKCDITGDVVDEAQGSTLTLMDADGNGHKWDLSPNGVAAFRKVVKADGEPVKKRGRKNGAGETAAA